MDKIWCACSRFSFPALRDVLKADLIVAVFLQKCISENSNSCKAYVKFITDTIYERVANGSMRVWGKVGIDEPPHLVLPLTVEPNKPRLCHDERFLNLWVCDKSVAA